MIPKDNLKGKQQSKKEYNKQYYLSHKKEAVECNRKYRLEHLKQENKRKRNWARYKKSK